MSLRSFHPKSRWNGATNRGNNPETAGELIGPRLDSQSVCGRDYEDLVMRVSGILGLLDGNPLLRQRRHCMIQELVPCMSLSIEAHLIPEPLMIADML